MRPVLSGKKIQLACLAAVAGVLLGGFVVGSHLLNKARADGDIIIGVQLSEEGGDESSVPGAYGDAQYATFNNQSFSDWAQDNNAFDPNYARIFAGGAGSISSGQDFRFGIQATDGPGNGHDPGCGSGTVGSTAYTPWASDGGGSSGWAGDNIVFDTNCVRVWVQTRQMPADKRVTDFRLGVEVGNRTACHSSNPGGAAKTPWASAGGGWSGFAFGPPNDFDCIAISLESKVVHYGSIEVKTALRGGGAPPPTTWVVANSRTNGIVAQQGEPGATTATYDDLPQGLYTIDLAYVKSPVNYNGHSYVLDYVNDNGCGVGKPVCPDTSSLLGTFDDTCTLAGYYNPHSTCSNGNCVVATGCGVSDCSACEDPRGTPERPPRVNSLGVPKAFASVPGGGDGDSHNVCQGTACESVSGIGTDACFSDVDCGGTPPNLGGGGTPPPPARLAFTIWYVLSSGGPPPANLNVNLTATPNFGNPPLPVSLKATVTGGSGPVTYHWWWNCNQGGTVLSTLRNLCGPEDKIDGPTDQVLDQVSNTYGAAAVRYPKVLIERGGSVAQDITTVNVGGGPPPAITCSGPTSTIVNAPVTFTGHGAPAGETYTWDSLAGGGTGDTFTVTFTNPGGKTVTATNGAESGTCQIVVNPAPEPPNCTGPATTTINQVVTFAGHKGNGSVYDWSSSQGTGHGQSYSVSFPAAGQQTITVRTGSLSGTCNVTVLPAGGNMVVCQGPAGATTNQDAVFNALGGSGAYSWSGGGTPASAGDVPTFTTNWGLPGTKVVTATRGTSSSTCSIAISAPSSSLGCNIVVNSNTPANWLISGPTQDGQSIRSPGYQALVSGATHTTDNSGNRLQEGVYVILPTSTVPTGRNPAVTPSDSQFCADGATIHFDLDYQPPTDGVLACAADNPYTIQGSPASFTATGGAGGYTWTGGNNPPTGSGPNFVTTFNAAGNRTVTVKDSAMATATCSVSVGPLHPPCQCYGPSHLLPGEDGTFYGSGGSGTCTSWSASAGGWGTAVPNQGNGPIFTTHFTAVGGTKLVTVAGSGAPATCIVDVSNNNHRECRFNSCALVNGVGPDRCSTSADCGVGPVFHGVCDSRQRACVNQVGAGGGTCTDDPSCAGSTDSHLECQNNSCVIAGGAGLDSCDEVGSSCTGGPMNPGGTCTFIANPKVISRGDSSRLIWSCNGGISSCSVSNLKTGSTVGGGGASSNVLVLPTSTTPYQLSCDGGVFTASTTVRVLSIIEVPPR